MPEYNLDTSVIINGLYTALPGDLEEDMGAIDLLDGDLGCVIGGHVEGEFGRICERRYDLYEDIVDWMNETGGEIFSYDPSSRSIHVSGNDRTHLRNDIQMSWHDMPRRKQLSILRRCHQRIQVEQQRLLSLLNDVFPQSTNAELLANLNGLGIGFDAQVVVDAVEIHRNEDIRTVVAKDNDITESTNVESINDVIRRFEDERFCLDFLDLRDIQS